MEAKIVGLSSIEQIPLIMLLISITILFTLPYLVTDAYFKRTRGVSFEITFDRLETLSESDSESVLITSKVYLITGAHWSKAENLENSQAKSCRITHQNTKDKKVHTVPISKKLYDEISKKCRKLFSLGVEHSSSLSIRQIFYYRQYPHVLIASHFMMNGGNILVLRDILRHSDIKMTMIYAHFAPSHLEDTVTKKPLNFMG